MYWPSRPKDGPEVFRMEPGEALSADGILKSYVDWHDYNERPLSSRAKEHRLTPHGKKMEDPCEKPGIVGAFCRTYSVTEALTEFLSDVYEPTTQPDRWTFKEGTSACGLVLYDDKFAYSHHATDPICGREVNAFDLVRIHKFGDQDAQAGEEVKVSQLPSFKAMESWAMTLPKVKVDIARHSVDNTSVAEDFGKALAEEQNVDWMTKLEYGKDHKVLSRPDNFLLICKNDPAIKDSVKWDTFADVKEITRDLPWAALTKDHHVWGDNDDNGLIVYVCAKYKGLTGKTALIDAHNLVMSQSGYHPLRDYLNSLKWDGTPRLDTVVIDYLGAEDTELTRAMTHKHLVAAIARVMEPGIKYEYVLAFSGKEGIGKSTLIKVLGMRWYNNSFSSGDVGSKDSKEQLRGQWLVELGELKDLKRNSNESFKAFFTTDTDIYRPAYGRNVVHVPRQCVFFATTNEENYLKGDTGNRRFWPIRVGVVKPTKNVFAIQQYDIDQIWAEAIHYYKNGEKLCLDGELDRQARAMAEKANELSGDTRIGLIEAFIRKPITEDWRSKSRKERRDYCMYGHKELTGTCRRQYICVQEIGNELFGKDLERWEATEVNQMLKRIPGLTFVGPYRTADEEYGSQRRYRIEEEFWKSESCATKGCSTDRVGSATDLEVGSAVVAQKEPWESDS